MENETGAATARVLMLLSQQQRQQRHRSGRLFECKTCGRRFPTFQALGGHRASHRRPGPYGAGLRHESQKLEAACAAGPRVHGCPICGVEFAVGQALGGHMRRHRPAATNARAQGSMIATPEACSSGSTASAKAEDIGEDCAGGICLELNLTPSASCAKCQKNAGLGAKPQSVQKMSILGCILRRAVE